MILTQEEAKLWGEILIGFSQGKEYVYPHTYDKANEWHYVKDGKPKDNEFVLIYTNLKNIYVGRIPTERDYFIVGRGMFVPISTVIAWCEIPQYKEK